MCECWEQKCWGNLSQFWQEMSLGEQETFHWLKSLFFKTCLFDETAIWPSWGDGSLWCSAAGGGCYLSRWQGKPLMLACHCHPQNAELQGFEFLDSLVKLQNIVQFFFFFFARSGGNPNPGDSLFCYSSHKACLCLLTGFRTLRLLLTLPSNNKPKKSSSWGSLFVPKLYFLYSHEVLILMASEKSK